VRAVERLFDERSFVEHVFDERLFGERPFDCEAQWLRPAMIGPRRRFRAIAQVTGRYVKESQDYPDTSLMVW